jgi:hypothetical protein
LLNLENEGTNKAKFYCVLFDIDNIS